MKATQFFLIILLCSYTQQATTVQQSVCPPWFVHDNRSSTGCSCYNDASVHCDSHIVGHWKWILYDLWQCKWSYWIQTLSIHCTTTNPGIRHVWYIKLPRNVSSLTEFMCGPLNREGLLCGKCKDGYGTALYSYTLKCSKCWGMVMDGSCTISWNFFP